MGKHGIEGVETVFRDAADLTTLSTQLKLSCFQRMELRPINKHKNLLRVSISYFYLCNNNKLTNEQFGHKKIFTGITSPSKKR